MLGGMTMLASILTMLNPVATKFGGIGAIIALRAVQGLAQVSPISDLYSPAQVLSPGKECPGCSSIPRTTSGSTR